MALVLLCYCTGESYFRKRVGIKLRQKFILPFFILGTTAAVHLSPLHSYAREVVSTLIYPSCQTYSAEELSLPRQEIQRDIERHFQDVMDFGPCPESNNSLKKYPTQATWLLASQFLEGLRNQKVQHLTTLSSQVESQSQCYGDLENPKCQAIRESWPERQRSLRADWLKMRQELALAYPRQKDFNALTLESTWFNSEPQHPISGLSSLIPLQEHEKKLARESFAHDVECAGPPPCKSLVAGKNPILQIAHSPTDFMVLQGQLDLARKKHQKNYSDLIEQNITIGFLNGQSFKSNRDHFPQITELQQALKVQSQTLLGQAKQFEKLDPLKDIRYVLGKSLKGQFVSSPLMDLMEGNALIDQKLRASPTLQNCALALALKDISLNHADRIENSKILSAATVSGLCVFTSGMSCALLSVANVPIQTFGPDQTIERTLVSKIQKDQNDSLRIVDSAASLLSMKEARDRANLSSLALAGGGLSRASVAKVSQIARAHKPIYTWTVFEKKMIEHKLGIIPVCEEVIARRGLIGVMKIAFLEICLRHDESKVMLEDLGKKLAKSSGLPMRDPVPAHLLAQQKELREVVEAVNAYDKKVFAEVIRKHGIDAASEQAKELDKYEHVADLVHRYIHEKSYETQWLLKKQRLDNFPYEFGKPYTKFTDYHSAWKNSPTEKPFYDLAHDLENLGDQFHQKVLNAMTPEKVQQAKKGLKIERRQVAPSSMIDF